jgi:YesN/AraC family two-component response regulator
MVVGGIEESLSVDKLMEMNLDEVIAEYDDRLYMGIQQKDYDKCEHLLTEFCFELVDLPDKEQVFIARTFFISLITDVIRTLNRKKRLNSKTLSFSYHVISEIEKWENISEYILSIRWLMGQMQEWIIGDQVLANNSEHIDKALKLINDHLEGDLLTVTWLAAKLNISTTHLGNLFKLSVGETVSSFITKRKLNEITFEMTYTDKTLKTIREKYGYYNHSHFIQHFKRHLGTTPLKYKQQLVDKV